VVRRWQAALTRGINTVTWDLQAERANGAPDDAAAGSYTMEVSIGAARAARKIKVRVEGKAAP
jgi:hypothetical protein